MEIKKILTDKKNLPVLFILICAVLIFLIWGNQDGETKQVSEENSVAQLEERLEKVLSKAKGAGKVSVFVFPEDYGNTVYAKDSKEVKKDEQIQSDKITVMQGAGSASSPVISRVESPGIKGIIVVAEGAGNPVVKTALAEAVEASLDIMPHRIKVLEGSR